MRLVRLATAYAAYLQTFYRSRPALVQASYEEQLAALNHDAFGWADFWDRALAIHGYEMRSILANAAPLQRAWAREHGVRFEHSHWERDVAAAQIAAYAPEILLVEDFGRFSAEWLREIRRRTPSLRLVVGWCGAPYESVEGFRALDLVLSNIPEVIEDLRSRGFHCEHMEHAFEPRILDRLPSESQTGLEFSFIGQVSNEPGAHRERLRMLKRVQDEIGIAIFSLQEGGSTLAFELKTGISRQAYFAMHRLKRYGVSSAMIERIPLFGKVARSAQAPRKAALFTRLPSSIVPGMRPPVFGLEMFAILRDSKASFNSHIGLSKRSATNMRLFEVTGAGGCLVTDWKENLHELFELDREVVCYRSVEECIEKVRWLLAHPVERDRIARAGQARTLRDHTFAARAPRLDGILRKHLH